MLMQWRRVNTSLCSALLLAGCSGGSGGSGSVNTISTTPSPPPVTTSLASLVTNENFANSAATQTSAINTVTEDVISGSSTSQALTVAYDLASNSYTITTQGRSQTFAPANQTSAAGGIAIYAITSGATTDRLTLESATFPGYASTSPQYSGLGYWQRTVASGTTSDVTVDFFIYGLNTAASAVPRTGQAAFATSVYGLVTLPGSEERFFQGSGRTDVDFLDGLFTTKATLSETGIQSQTNYGSGATLTGSGTLSSSSNALTGAVTYTGLNSTSTGMLNGQFYGPKAQELGGAFTTSGADGSSTSGVIWGNQNAGLAPVNLTMANIVADQTFASSEAQTPAQAGNGGIDTGTVAVTAAGEITVTPQGLPATTMTSANVVTGSNANFNAYAQGSGNNATTLTIYKAGSANTELALTYMTFGSWTGPQAAGSSTGAASWFAYGLNSPASVIAARTGSAKYTGVAYGTATPAGGSGSTVSGTASVSVNFDFGGYAGSFALKNATTDYGTFNMTGTIGAGTPRLGSITGTTAGSGAVLPAFYGPTGQEFGGPFQISIPATGAAGATTIIGVVAGKGG